MKLRDKEKVLVATALVALATLQAPAQADSTAAEIGFLKARLKLLEEKVAHRDKQIRVGAKFPAMLPGPETPIVCKDQPCPLPPPPIFVSFKNGLKVESFDHDFSFRIGGRLFVDGGVSDHPVQAFVGIPPFTFFPSHPGSGFSNQVGFRRAVWGSKRRDGETVAINFSMTSRVRPTTLSQGDSAMPGSRGSPSGQVGRTSCVRMNPVRRVTSRRSLSRWAASMSLTAWKGRTQPSTETSSKGPRQATDWLA